ncbi:MAG: hypothetical protein K0S10_1949, partial [Rubrobacteraceae bacterium]|nr:hypothetical protein [Rubrobacteraceae bacterium]
MFDKDRDDARRRSWAITTGGERRSGRPG